MKIKKRKKYIKGEYLSLDSNQMQIEAAIEYMLTTEQYLIHTCLKHSIFRSVPVHFLFPQNVPLQARSHPCRAPIKFALSVRSHACNSRTAERIFV
jgi:hypothetical protein